MQLPAEYTEILKIFKVFKIFESSEISEIQSQADLLPALYRPGNQEPDEEEYSCSSENRQIEKQLLIINQASR